MIAPDLLFVYGTLRRGLRDDLLRRLDASFVGAGSIQGRLYDLGRYPGAKRSLDSTDRVRGEVHRLPNPEVALAVLDEYEGIAKDTESKSEFVRDTAGVSLDDGRELRAWVYLFNRPVDESRLIQGGDYRYKIGDVRQFEEDLAVQREAKTK